MTEKLIHLRDEISVSSFDALTFRRGAIYSSDSLTSSPTPFFGGKISP